MGIAIAAAVLAALAAIVLARLLLAARGELRETAARLARADEALHAAHARHAAELHPLREQLASGAAQGKDQAQESARMQSQLAALEQELSHAKEELAQFRRGQSRRARESFDALRQQLLAEGVPERIEAFAQGQAPALSEIAKRLLKDVEWWLEQGLLEGAAVAHTLGVLDYARGDAKSAEARLRAAARVSADTVLWENLGDLMSATGRPKRAVEGYRKAAQKAPDDSPVQRKLALALYAAGEFGAAVKPLSLALRASPDNPELHMKTARALLESGDALRAVDMAQAAAQRFPQSAAFHAIVISALARSRRFPEAHAAFERAMAVDAGNAEAHVARGMAFLEEGRTEDAVASFQTALKGADLAEAHYGLGVAANRNQQHEAAIEHLKRAVALRPDYAEAWYAKKTAFEALRQFEPAVEALNRAVALKPDLVG